MPFRLPTPTTHAVLHSNVQRREAQRASVLKNGTTLVREERRSRMKKKTAYMGYSLGETGDYASSSEKRE